MLSIVTSPSFAAPIKFRGAHYLDEPLTDEQHQELAGLELAPARELKAYNHLGADIAPTTSKHPYVYTTEGDILKLERRIPALQHSQKMRKKAYDPTDRDTLSIAGSGLKELIEQELLGTKQEQRPAVDLLLKARQWGKNSKNPFKPQAVIFTDNPNDAKLTEWLDTQKIAHTSIPSHSQEFFAPLRTFDLKQEPLVRHIIQSATDKGIPLGITSDHKYYYEVQDDRLTDLGTLQLSWDFPRRYRKQSLIREEYSYDKLYALPLMEISLAFETNKIQAAAKTTSKKVIKPL